MSPRVLLILAVLLVMLFAIGAFIPGCRQEPAWFGPVRARFEASQKLNLSTDIEPSALSADIVKLPPGSPVAVIRIRTNDQQKVRRLQLVLGGAGPIQLEYTPNGRDPAAIPIKISSFKPGETNSLVILQAGGTITLRRNDILLPAWLKLD